MRECVCVCVRLQDLELADWEKELRRQMPGTALPSDLRTPSPPTTAAPTTTTTTTTTPEVREVFFFSGDQFVKIRIFFLL